MIVETTSLLEPLTEKEPDVLDDYLFLMAASHTYERSERRIVNAFGLDRAGG